MNDVELALSRDGPLHRLSAYVELLARKIPDEIGDLTCRKVDHDVNVVCKAGLTVEDRRDGACHEIAETELLQDCRAVPEQLRLIHARSSARFPVGCAPRPNRDAPPRDGWRSSAGRRRTGRWQSSDARLLSSPAGRGPCRRPRPRSAGHPGIWPWSLW